MDLANTLELLVKLASFALDTIGATGTALGLFAGLCAIAFAIFGAPVVLFGTVVAVLTVVTAIATLLQIPLSQRSPDHQCRQSVTARMRESLLARAEQAAQGASWSHQVRLRTSVSRHLCRPWARKVCGGVGGGTANDPLLETARRGWSPNRARVAGHGVC